MDREYEKLLSQRAAAGGLCHSIDECIKSLADLEIMPAAIIAQYKKLQVKMEAVFQQWCEEDAKRDVA